MMGAPGEPASPFDAIARYVRMPFSPRPYAGVVERLLLSARHAPSRPQLFILGLPRSGTTLIYQYLVHRLKVAYFTNGVGDFPNAPVIATLLQKSIHGRFRSDFQSRYGKVDGPLEPREAGGFWARFFDPERYVDYDDLPQRQVDVLRRTVAAMETVFGGAPFVNKNVKHLLRIGAMKRIFPECHFVVVERDRADVAISLLRGRYEAQADPRQWLSARPPDFEALKDRPLVEQIAGQLASLNARLEQDLSALDADDVTRVDYRAFCAEPELLVERLRPSILDVQTRNSARRSFHSTPSERRNEEEEALARLVLDARA